MAEASEYPQPAAEGESNEALVERLGRLERAITSMQVHSANASVAGNDAGMAGLIPSALIGAMIPGLAPSPQEIVGRSSWLKEFRMMFRMYIDPRYRLSRVGQFGVPIVIALAVLNYLTFQFAWPVPIVAPIFERLFLIALAVALYKILSREVARYVAVLAYLARYTLPTA